MAQRGSPRVSKNKNQNQGAGQPGGEAFRSLFGKGQAFLEAKPWTKIPPGGAFIAVVGGERFACDILGQDDEEFGLTATRGAQHLAAMIGLIEGWAEDDQEFLEQISVLELGTAQMNELTPEGRSQIKKAGFERKGDDVVPIFMTKEPWESPRDLNSREMEQLKGLMSLILDAGELLAPPNVLEEEKILVLDRDAEGKVVTSLEVVDFDTVEFDPYALPDSLGRMVKRYGTRRGQWTILREVFGEPEEAPEADEDGHVALAPRQGVVVFDNEDSEPVAAAPCKLESIAEALGAVCAVAQAELEVSGKALPKKLMVVDAELKAAIEKALAGVSVTVELGRAGCFQGAGHRDLRGPSSRLYA